MINPKQRLTPLSEYFGKITERQLEEGVDNSFTKNMNLLEEYSITTIEELAALYKVDEQSEEKYLENIGVEQEFFQEIMVWQGSDPGRQEMSDWNEFEGEKYTTGCVSDEILNEKEESDFDVEKPLSPAINLIDEYMPRIKDQQKRPTCVAFSTLSCLEYHNNKMQSNHVDFSEQFQYWNMVDKHNRHALHYSFPLINTQGVCEEEHWPYNGEEIAGNDSQGPPPNVAMCNLNANYCLSTHQILPRDVRNIQKVISSGKLVAVAIPVYRSWMMSVVVRKYGNITMPLKKDRLEPMGHAITLVGYQDDPDFAGGGFFVVRNSWGDRWGKYAPFGEGYGTIPYKYIAKYNWEAWHVS